LPTKLLLHSKGILEKVWNLLKVREV